MSGESGESSEELLEADEADEGAVIWRFICVLRLVGERAEVGVRFVGVVGVLTARGVICSDSLGRGRGRVVPADVANGDTARSILLVLLLLLLLLLLWIVVAVASIILFFCSSSISPMDSVLLLVVSGGCD